ncbi:GspE/PulE family protein [Paenibacillus alkalitolerans]|uniref:GspE/PulE family protein n=1 Tax=Paenibacillus alkalitolerans TaxID=2799335 RepID=UPI0018F7784A|nr:ATPase, T2SS/T4P/T4SS family [Paenibacillus alkalitolerans]
MRIGELLKMNNLITEEQLIKALDQQVHSSTKLGEILVDQGAITELQLSEALEFQLGVPVIHLNEAIIEKDAVQLIDKELAARRNVIPVERRAGKIRLAMLDPQHQETIDEVRAVTGMSIQPLIAMRSELQQMIKLHYGDDESEQILTELLTECLNDKSNEIFLDPQEAGLVVKYKLESGLKAKKKIAKDKQQALIHHIKRLAKIPSTDSLLPHEGRFATTINEHACDVTASTLPTLHGENAFLKIKKRLQEISALSELGFSEEQLGELKNALQRRNGLILISGPSGSGKTGTLYSTLAHVKKDELQISTIEDPIEHRLEGVTQVEVNERAGLTYGRGLQAILRQNPNIVMVGDMKGVDTGEIAVKASLTDCLLIGAIESASMIETIKRFEKLGIDSRLVASSLVCVVHQQSVRQVCSQCAQSVPMTDEETKLFEEHNLLQQEQEQASKTVFGNFRTMVSAHFNGKMVVTRGSGCRLCSNSGYRGQTVLYEVLTIDETLRKLISQQLPVVEYEEYLKKKGHKTMFYDGLFKARSGKTTVDEVLKIR